MKAWKDSAFVVSEASSLYDDYAHIATEDTHIKSSNAKQYIVLILGIDLYIYETNLTVPTGLKPK